jgi:hypothetical protein
LSHKNTPKYRRRKYLIITTVLVTAILISLGLIFYYGYNNRTKPITTNKPSTEQQAYSKDFINSNNSEENKANLSEKYSSKYAEASQLISGTNPAQWNKQKVNDACASLLFVSKMDSYSQALQYLALLEEAKANGVNIDDNDYGVNQKVRDDIYTKSTQASDKALGGGS